MKVSARSAVTIFAAVLVLGGLVRLGLDKRRVAVELPEANEASAALTTP